MKTLSLVYIFSICVSLSWDINLLPLDSKSDWNLHHHVFWVSSLPTTGLGISQPPQSQSREPIPYSKSTYLPTYLPVPPIGYVSLEVSLITLR